MSWPEVEALAAIDTPAARAVVDAASEHHLVARYPTETVRQALLWASCNATRCAPAFAALLWELSESATVPFDEGIAAILADLGLHVTAFKRDAAYGKLCAVVGMTLDRDVEY